MSPVMGFTTTWGLVTGFLTVSREVWDCQKQKGNRRRPDPFGSGAYNLQSISVLRRNRVWSKRLGLRITETHTNDYSNEITNEPPNPFSHEYKRSA